MCAAVTLKQVASRVCVHLQRTPAFHLLPAVNQLQLHILLGWRVSGGSEACITENVLLSVPIILVVRYSLLCYSSSWSVYVWLRMVGNVCFGPCLATVTSIYWTVVALGISSKITNSCEVNCGQLSETTGSDKPYAAVCVPVHNNGTTCSDS